MKVRLHVTGLPPAADIVDLAIVFRNFHPTNVMLATDKETGESRGFGYVEVSEAEAEDAIRMTGDVSLGRRISVHVANPRPNRRK